MINVLLFLSFFLRTSEGAGPLRRLVAEGEDLSDPTSEATLGAGAQGKGGTSEGEKEGEPSSCMDKKQDARKRAIRCKFSDEEGYDLDFYYSAISDGFAGSYGPRFFHENHCFLGSGDRVGDAHPPPYFAFDDRNAEVLDIVELEKDPRIKLLMYKKRQSLVARSGTVTDSRFTVSSDRAEGRPSFVGGPKKSPQVAGEADNAGGKLFSCVSLSAIASLMWNRKSAEDKLRAVKWVLEVLVLKTHETLARSPRAERGIVLKASKIGFFAKIQIFRGVLWIRELRASKQTKKDFFLIVSEKYPLGNAVGLRLEFLSLLPSMFFGCVSCSVISNYRLLKSYSESLSALMEVNFKSISFFRGTQRNPQSKQSYRELLGKHCAPRLSDVEEVHLPSGYLLGLSKEETRLVKRRNAFFKKKSAQKVQFDDVLEKNEFVLSESSKISPLSEVLDLNFDNEAQKVALIFFEDFKLGRGKSFWALFSNREDATRRPRKFMKNALDS